MLTRDFHIIVLATITDGIFNADVFSLNNFETRSVQFAQLSDMYRYYRFDKMEITADWYTGAVTIPEYFAIYFDPNATTATVPALSLLEGKFATGQSHPTGAQGRRCHLTLSNQQLHTAVDWFVTSNDTVAGPEFDGPGQLVFRAPAATTSDGSCYLEIHFTATFKSQLDPDTISRLMRDRVLEDLAQEAAARPKSNAQKGEIIDYPLALRRK